MKLAIAVIWCWLLLIITETARAEFPTPETPVRVYAPGAFNFEIIGQESDYEVTLQDGAVSLFEGPFMEYGVVGLLGHDYLAGAEFYELERGDWLVVWLEGGGLEAYQITEMRRFQAVGVDYPFQALEDLETGSVLSEEEVFEAMYRRPGGLVLQTCIDGGWGLAFWVGEKLNKRWNYVPVSPLIIAYARYKTPVSSSRAYAHVSATYLQEAI